MRTFLSDNSNRNFLDDITRPLKPKVYTIVVVYMDGYRKEYQGISNPWEYMRKVKTNPKVKTCYIK